MEKKTLYDKLIEAEPFVEKYHEVIRVSAMSEDDYIERECATNKFCIDANELIPKPNEKKHKTITKVLLGATAIGAILVVWGLIRLISTSGDFGGMDAAYGIALLVASFILRPRMAAKYNKEVAEYEQQQEKINEYNTAKEAARVKYRSLVETKDSVINAAKEKLKKLNLEEEPFLANDYYLSDDYGFLAMLRYAEQHPTHTTLRGYLKEKREMEQLFRVIDSLPSDENYYDDDGDSFEDALRRDREARFQHDYEMSRQEEERRRDERIKENMERERKEREEWLRESAEKRERQRREREERDAQRKRERDALSKCSHCVNSAKCSITTKYNSLNCGSYRPI